MATDDEEQPILGANLLQRTVDHLDHTVTRLETAFSKMVPALERASKNQFGSSGAGPGTSNWNANSNWLGANNGGVIGGFYQGRYLGGSVGGLSRMPGMFGGGGSGYVPTHSAGETPEDPYSGSATHRAPGNTMPWRAMAAGVGAGLAAGAGVSKAFSTSITRDDKVAAATSMYQTLYGQVGPNSSDKFFPRMTSAMSLMDQAQAQAGAAGVGFMPGSKGYGTLMNSASSTSFYNPSKSLSSSMNAEQGLMTGKSFGLLRMVGIDTMGKGGVPKGAAQIAQDILRMVDPGQQLNSIEKINLELNHPLSNLNQGLNNWVANGAIGQESVSAVKDQLRAILMARLKGVNAQQLASLTKQATSGNTQAQARLKQIGLGGSSLQGEKNKEGAERDIIVHQLDGFAKGLGMANKALVKLADNLDSIVGNDTVGELRGKLDSKKGFFAQVLDAAKDPVGLLNPGNLSIFGGGSGGSNESRMGHTSGGGNPGGSASSSQPHSSMAGVSNLSSLAQPHSAKGSSAAAMGGGSQPAGGGGGGGGAGGSLIFPVRAPLGVGFGVSGPMWASGHHTGQDFKCPSGTPIKASAAGTVSIAGWNSSYGNEIVINHGNGIQTRYAHNSRLKVKKGAQVRQGEIISFSGATGNVTGPHLHFEVIINGKAVDPMKFLRGAPLNIKPGAAGAGSGAAAGAAAPANDVAASGAGAATGSGMAIWENDILGLGGGMMAAGMTGTSTTAPTTAPGAGAGQAPGGGGKAGNFGGISGGGSSAQNKNLGRQMASRLGWVGKQWNALLELWNRESGWNEQADNPTSSAYGIPQAMLSIHKMPPGYVGRTTGSGSGIHGFGGDPKVQIGWGLNYIKGRYHNPAAALAFHNAHNWYDKGAWEIKQDETARVHKGEMVIPKPNADMIRSVLKNDHPYGKGSGSASIVFQENSVVIHLGGGATPSVGRKIAKEFVDAFSEDVRIKRMMSGAS